MPSKSYYHRLAAQGWPDQSLPIGRSIARAVDKTKIEIAADHADPVIDREIVRPREGAGRAAVGMEIWRGRNFNRKITSRAGPSFASIRRSFMVATDLDNSAVTYICSKNIVSKLKPTCWGILGIAWLKLTKSHLNLNIMGTYPFRIDRVAPNIYRDMASGTFKRRSELIKQRVNIFFRRSTIFRRAKFRRDRTCGRAFR